MFTMEEITTLVYFLFSGFFSVLNINYIELLSLPILRDPSLFNLLALSNTSVGRVAAKLASMVQMEARTAKDLMIRLNTSS